MEGFLRYEFGGPIFGGAYTWRALFSEFYGRSIADRRVPSNDRRKNCGTHLGSISLFISKKANDQGFQGQADIRSKQVNVWKIKKPWLTDCSAIDVPENHKKQEKQVPKEVHVISDTCDNNKIEK